MKTLFILLLTSQLNCLTLNDVGKLFNKNQDNIASYLLDRGYYLTNKTEQGVVQFEIDKKSFPSIDLFYTDNTFKKLKFVELRLTSENIKDYECFDQSFKAGYKKLRTSFNKTENNYITKYSDNIIDVYSIIFRNSFGRRVVKCIICRAGEQYPLYQ